MNTPHKSSKSRSRLIRPRACKSPEQIDRLGELLERVEKIEKELKTLRLNPGYRPVNPAPFSPFPWRDDLQPAPWPNPVGPITC